MNSVVLPAARQLGWCREDGVVVTEGTAHSDWDAVESLRSMWIGYKRIVVEPRSRLREMRGQRCTR